MLYVPNCRLSVFVVGQSNDINEQTIVFEERKKWKYKNIFLNIALSRFWYNKKIVVIQKISDILRGKYVKNKKYINDK